MTYIQMDKLQYIEGSGKIQLAHIVGKEQPTELHKSMQELEEELTPQGFLRIHKGYLLNYRFIRRIGDNEVSLTSGELLPISRRKYQEIRDAYMELMQNDGGVML
ncbi:MAG: LytTR family transcriptional regulator [Clostridia bacterium]|nr:LytTR family transcriptional regulator [Clostridia bacterium]